MLLNALGLAIRTHQGIKNDQHVAPIIHHARENITELRVMLRFAVPFGEDSRGDLDVPSQLIRRITAQEEAIEKRGFPLREVEIVHEIGESDLWRRSHKENAVYPKTFLRQVGLQFLCCVPGNSPLLRQMHRATRLGCNVVVASRF